MAVTGSALAVRRDQASSRVVVKTREKMVVNETSTSLSRAHSTHSSECLPACDTIRRPVMMLGLELLASTTVCQLRLSF